MHFDTVFALHVNITLVACGHCDAECAEWQGVLKPAMLDDGFCGNLVCETRDKRNRATEFVGARGLV